MISHFHGDHFFGLPFLLLDAVSTCRTKDLFVVGPPGIQERTEHLLHLAFPNLGAKIEFGCHYIEVRDGLEGEAAGLPFTAAGVEHARGLECFAFRARVDGRWLLFSGDSTLCDGLLRLAPGADVLVLECSCAREPTHLSPERVYEVMRRAPRGAPSILTHLDGLEHAEGFRALHVASDLARFSL